MVDARSIPNAKARYYLYYAPHDTPGGICVAFSDDITGPWREYESNPVIAASWSPHHDVEHVSSPHAIWRDDWGEMWVYYHGDNNCTRWATSTDGVHFDYGGVAIDAARLGMDGAAYARVFPSPFADSPARYLMVLLLYEYQPESWERFNQFGLYGAWSDDGCAWDVVQHPIVSHADCAPNDFVCSPSIATVDGKVVLAYHHDRATGNGPVTDVYAVGLDSRLRPTGSPALLCARQAFGKRNERISDPFLFNADGSWYLFGAIGPRLGQSLGAAIVIR